METVIAFAERILILTIAFAVTELAAPEGKLKKTVVFVCSVLLTASILGFDVIIPDIGVGHESDFSVGKRAAEATEKEIERMLDGVEGFKNCTVYAEISERDNICRVSSIVIYCKEAKDENDEYVTLWLSSAYGIGRENVRISR